MVNQWVDSAGGCTYWGPNRHQPYPLENVKLHLAPLMFDVVPPVGALGYEPAQPDISWCQLMPDSAVDWTFLCHVVPLSPLETGS
jgi:hypothetical protein